MHAIRYSLLAACALFLAAILLATPIFVPAMAADPAKPSAADLPADLTELEGELLLANPALFEVYRSNPEAGADILKNVKDNLSLTRSLSDRSKLTDAQKQLLDQNPALDEVYRESPEAALDIIRMIREAGEMN